jgi:cytochrome b561
MLKTETKRAAQEIVIEAGGLSQADIPTLFAPPTPPRTRVAGSSHPGLTIAIHWMTVAAIVMAVVAMFARDAIEDREWRQFLLGMHRQLGLLVLVGAGVRIAFRLRRGLANQAPDMAAVLKWAAKAAHVFMYGVLLALPLLGWAVTSAHGISMTFLGSVPLPRFLEADSELADTLTDYHVWLAWGLLALVIAHVGAALWHHFVRRDGVLRAMVPKRTQNSIRSLPTTTGPE